MTTLSRSAVKMNFVVVGPTRAGMSMAQSALDSLTRTVCHSDLLSADIERRQSACLGYYGDDLAFDLLDASPYSYLNSVVFDNPQYDEERIGVRMDYSFLRRWELDDYLKDKWREGDFCVIHVTRNPIVCFVSLQQAVQSKIWSRSHNDKQFCSPLPLPVYIEVEDLVQAVREDAATATRVKNACPDALVVPYLSLVFDYNRTIRRAAAFLEAPQPDRVPQPSFLRIRNSDVRDRVINWNDLLKRVPSDVREQMVHPEIY